MKILAFEPDKLKHKLFKLACMEDSKEDCVKRMTDLGATEMVQPTYQFKKWIAVGNK